MCGIVGYIGQKNCVGVLLGGLVRLEYRGYDSAGIAVIEDGRILVVKRAGKVKELIDEARGLGLRATVGIGHTRWATHGEPTDRNAHPHVSSSGRFAIVHNGIIENYRVLRKALEKQGYEFVSDTDTEVLVQLVDAIVEREGLPLPEALQLALREVVGAYAVVMIDASNPDIIVGARRSSPLIVGVGEGEFVIASDAAAIVEHTRKVVYLEDDQIVTLHRGGDMSIVTLHNERIHPFVYSLEIDIEQIEKGGYPHFMLKEIYEQSEAVANCMRGRVDVRGGKIRLGGIRDYLERLTGADRVVFMGCGTSWHAGLVGVYMFEELAGVCAQAEYASELRYRKAVIRPEKDIYVAISQSGETADTLAVLRMVKQKGAIVLGIVNVVGSSIARETHAGIYTHAGPEIGVASTKAFVTQLVALLMMAMVVGRQRRHLTQSLYHLLLEELGLLPNKIRETLKANEKTVERIAQEFYTVGNFLYLGRGYNYPIALEGALKLKEISYIHAEGYPAAEMKHGPIALIDENMPVLVIATNMDNYDKVLSNAQEVKARRGRLIAVVTSEDVELRQMSEYVIEVPAVPDPISPILTVVPLQLLAYKIAVLKGCDVDQPRNLAKSVTVE